MKIRCCRCGELFLEDEYEEGCPFCGSDDTEDVVRCPECGRFVRCDFTEGDLCMNCAGETLRLFREVLHLYFSPEQEAFLAASDCF